MTAHRDLPHDDNVVRAAQWLADQSTPPYPITAELQKRFGLPRACTCAAIKLAGDMRLLRRAFG